MPISMRKSATQPKTQGAGRTSEELIREWVGRFAVNCGQVLSDARVLLWIDELGGIDPDLLEQAFRIVLQTHSINTIPQIGAVHDALQSLRTNASLNERRVASQRWLANQPSDEELHRRGLEYSAGMKARTEEIAKLQTPKLKAEVTVIETPERRALLDQQKQKLLASATPEGIHKAAHLRGRYTAEEIAALRRVGELPRNL